MKIHLSIANTGDARSGYVNVDPAATEATPGVSPGDPADLSPFCDANEATELVALDVLDAYPVWQADEVLDHWLSRLAHGATLAVSALDVRELSRAVFNSRIDIDRANVLMYGTEERPRKAAYSLDLLAAVLENKGLLIKKKRVEDFRAVVVAERP